MGKIDLRDDQPSEEEMLKNKDFKATLKQAEHLQNSPTKTYLIAAVVGVAAFFITSMLLKSGSAKTDGTQNAAHQQDSVSNASYQAKYESPTGHGIDFQELKGVVQVDDPMVFALQSGTKITIPIHTLINDRGQLIQGEVTFRYREFLDQKEVFQGGIPMTYAKEGEDLVFESGGMFELLAYQNGQPVYIAPQKRVQVDLASKQVGDHFREYYYSPKDSMWIDKGQDEQGFSPQELAWVDSLLKEKGAFQELTKISKQSRSAQESFQKITKTKPIKPIPANESKPSFTIEVNYKHFPELQAMEGVKFQVSDKETNFKAAYSKEIWHSAMISRGDESHEFVTCFKNIKQGEKCFLTNPVIDKGQLKSANERYEALMEAYLFKKDSIVKRMADLKEKLASRIRTLNEERIVALNSRNRDLSQVVENTVTRTFQIANFGIWNSDCPQKLPQEAIVKADFVDESGTPLMFHRMYLVLKDKNMVITLYPEVFRKGIPYNPDQDCMLWAVTPDLKSVAVFNTSQFKAINKSQKTHTFNMKLVSSKVFDKQTVEGIFNI